MIASGTLISRKDYHEVTVTQVADGLQSLGAEIDGDDFARMDDKPAAAYDYLPNALFLGDVTITVGAVQTVLPALHVRSRAVQAWCIGQVASAGTNA